MIVDRISCFHGDETLLSLPYHFFSLPLSVTHWWFSKMQILIILYKHAKETFEVV